MALLIASILRPFLFSSLIIAFYADGEISLAKLTGGFEEETLKISAVGDIMAHSTQLTSAYNSKCKCYDFSPVFRNVKKYLSQSELRIGNLETTLPGDPRLFAGYPNFGAPDELAGALKEAGIDVLTTSNNHCVDRGGRGIDRTVDALDAAGIRHAGTYKSKEEYEKNRVLIYRVKGFKIALLAYSYGTNGIRIPRGRVVNIINRDLIAEDIRLARRQDPDQIIVYYHFGPEYARFPDRFQKDIVDFTFQEGADIVLGGHPHVLQAYDVKWVKDRHGELKQRMVVYSLGNFVSGQVRRYTNGGVIFNFTVAKKAFLTRSEYRLRDINYVPVFVYVSRQKDARTYNVLPVEEYLRNDKELKLTAAAHRSMLRFYEDTNSHLQKYSKIEVNP